MSGSEPRRAIAPLALLLLSATGCGGSEGDSTLPSEGREANPAPLELALEPPTPETVGSHVEAKARALAARAYTPPDTALPPPLDRLDYEQYQSIRFRPEAALWSGETPFTVQLLHPGYLFRAPVRIHVAQGGRVTTLPFDAGHFRYGNPAAGPGDGGGAELGYSGFRVHYPMNEPGVEDEVVVFQGASYFRLLGPGHVHGLSSRGLAIDIGEYSGEEFPAFTEFWLIKPPADAGALVFHALLESPSLTGAYRFVLEPGGDPSAGTGARGRTELAVEARLFARRDVGKLGVAPLSSMFLYGPNRAGEYDDFRPEVHDSDGLLMLTRAGEWIWRPLANRRQLRVTSLRDTDLQGFGLAQRTRAFARFLDLETLYHRRPSEWVQAEEGDWGAGGVELLEAPTDSEFSDNIAASWVPDEQLRAGDERSYRYRLVAFDGRLREQPLAQVERTGIGWDALPGQASPPPRSQRRIVVDFADGPLTALEPSAELTAHIHTSAGEVSDVGVVRLPEGREWRVSFRLTPEGTRPADMRLHLEDGGRRVSETWSYVWYPEEAR